MDIKDVILLGLILVFGWATRRQARHWRSAAAMWECATRQGRGEKSRAWQEWGAAVKMNGDMAGAATGFQKALDLNPRQAPALRNLAWLRAEQNHPLEALALLKTCVERNPGHGAGWQDYGLLLEGTGHPDEAIGAFQRALELQPRFDVSANRLGIIHFVRRDWERARAFFARAHQFRPESGEYRWNLACSLRAMGLAQESHALVKGFPAQIQLTPNMVVPPDAVPERMTP